MARVRAVLIEDQQVVGLARRTQEHLGDVVAFLRRHGLAGLGRDEVAAHVLAIHEELALGQALGLKEDRLRGGVERELAAEPSRLACGDA